MSVSPEAARLRAALARHGRRLRRLAVLRGAAVGLAVTASIALLLWLSGWPADRSDRLVIAAVLAVAGAAAGALVGARQRHGVAERIEAKAPGCRNVVITAAELLEDPARVPVYVLTRVFALATARLEALAPGTLFPARRAILAVAGGLLLWSAAIPLLAASPPVALPAGLTGAAPAIRGVQVIVHPPRYVATGIRTLDDPARIEAPAGSRLEIVARAAATAVMMETAAGRVEMAARAAGEFRAQLTADADGFIALEPAANGETGDRWLMGLSVQPDAPPAVRITAPAQDLVLPDAQRMIDVTIEAEDDHALAALSLQYTKVSGSGEVFTFDEGELAVNVTRSDPAHWRARASIPVAQLAGEPGDMIVYRAAARDARPGAEPVLSDAFIVEIRSPGSVAAEGFALDDEQDRYAISQQMVILLTERLIARSNGMAAESLSAEARTIAAAQRQVRAEFVFMMGGELAEEITGEAGIQDLDEEAHAEADADLIGGRLANQGRAALIQAIRAMSRANTALNETDLTRALTEEKAALDHLQRAFSRTRYILRALTERERLDLARRLTGSLEEARGDARPITETTADPRVFTLRQALASVAAMAAQPEMSPADADTASAIASRLLQTDPASTALQSAATQLLEAAAAVRASRQAEAHRRLGETATQLAATIRNGLPAAPDAPAPLELRRLEGALTDVLQRARRSP